MNTIIKSMTIDLNESISVGTVFARGTVRPVWFSLKGRQILIKGITLVWKTREGSTAVFLFSVTDGQGLYELRYNTGTLAWRLSASA